MKNWILIVLLFMIPTILVGQSVSPSLISSSGSQVNTDQLQLQWSLGEFVISQTTDPGLQLSLGFHQNLAPGSSTSKTLPQPEPPYQVFPNPTTAFIKIEMLKHSGLILYKIQDALGNLILNGSFVNNTSVNVTSLPEGIYFLTLSQRHKLLGSSKIIKL